MAFHLPKHWVGQPVLRKVFTRAPNGQMVAKVQKEVKTPGRELFQKLYKALEDAPLTDLRGAYIAEDVLVNHGGRTHRYNLAYQPKADTLIRTLSTRIGRTYASRQGVRRTKWRDAEMVYKASGEVRQITLNRDWQFNDRDKNVLHVSPFDSLQFYATPTIHTTPDIQAGIAPVGAYTRKTYPVFTPHSHARWHTLQRYREFYMRSPGLEIDKTMLDYLPARFPNVIRFNLPAVPNRR